MAFRIFAGSSLRTPATVKIMAGGSLRSAQTVKMMIGGTLRTIFLGVPAMSATATPSVSGISTSATVQTNSATLTPSGGIPPYTYLWTVLSYDQATAPVIVAPSFATTNFRQGAMASDDTANATFRGTATDSLGNTAHADVTASFTRIGTA